MYIYIYNDLYKLSKITEAGLVPGPHGLLGSFPELFFCLAYVAMPQFTNP